MSILTEAPLHHTETAEAKPAVQTLAMLGSYTPRQCGIATFTKDLHDALAVELSPGSLVVVAMDDQGGDYDYPAEVRFQIPQHKQSAYLPPADMLNINQIDVCLIQHEYGIFGGNDGSHVLDFARDLRMPIITTLHTVLPSPSAGQRAVLREICRVSDRVVVMSRSAHQILTDVYGANPERIAYIPHGIPDVPFVDPNYYKDQFGVEGKKVILTFGLLGPGKGIEVVLRAMPMVVAKHPDAVYIILGATHPHIVRKEGHAYRHSLERLVEELGIENNVLFHNRYVSQEELNGYIGVADIYVTPYPNPQQITSGTLAYAMGAGKPVVATPYLYAKEMLGEGRGRLFDFGNSEALAEQLVSLFDDETERSAIRTRAYKFARPMVWKEVARSYLGLANTVLAERALFPKQIRFQRAAANDVESTPELNLAHLHRLTDDTGILQHAIYATPDRHHGYCIDDNARALITALSAYDLVRDETVLPLMDRYLSFLHFGYNEQTGRFRNFMSYDRRWLEETGSEDVHGRAIWALGHAVYKPPTDAIGALAMRLISPALNAVEAFTSPRAWAFSLIGIERYLYRYSGDTHARRLRQTLATRLLELFTRNGDEQWPWCEDTITYDNAKLPHALLVAGESMNEGAMVAQGLKSLEWLVHQQIIAGRVSLIGNHGWLDRHGNRARFDQQPIEAMAMVEACAVAYRLTTDDAWYDRARKFLDWFIGNNDTGSALYDYQTGGCRDGLSPGGPNLNQGAESTLGWLIALLTVMDMNRVRTIETDELLNGRLDQATVGQMTQE
jgi:glycosyltransferase involved in cell wall biosynthesis